MSERYKQGYKISFQPYKDDPKDPHSESNQDRLFTEAEGRAGMPGATDAIYSLRNCDWRAHFVIVEGNSKVVRVLRAPLKGSELPPEVWDEAMKAVMSEIGKKYPHPKYDWAFGGSCLEDAERAWVVAINFHRIPIENIVVTPVN